jgi:hypothetical protein
MNQDELIASFQGVLAHLWMIRTFLKHADEIQDDENMLEVPRTLFDYFHRLNGKFSRLKKANIYYQENFKTFSDHTNFQMAASSLAACVSRLQELLDLVDKLPQQPSSSSGPAI